LLLLNKRSFIQCSCRISDGLVLHARSLARSLEKCISWKISVSIEVIE